MFTAKIFLLWSGVQEMIRTGRSLYCGALLAFEIVALRHEGRKNNLVRRSADAEHASVIFRESRDGVAK